MTEIHEVCLYFRFRRRAGADHGGPLPLLPSALEEVGVAIDRGQFYRQAGMTGHEQIRYFADRAGVGVDVEAVYRRKRAIWEAGDYTVTAIDCNVSLLRARCAAGVPVAIASGNSRQSVVPVMKQHGLEVDAVVGAEDVARGKPAPTCSFVPPNGWAARRPTVS